MNSFDKAMARGDAAQLRVYGSDVEIVSSGEVVRGVFNDPSTIEDMGGFEIDFSKPSISMPDASADKIVKGASLQVKGNFYEVAKPRAKDGSGWTILSIF